ncbi:MAG: hypothetical protein HC812_15725 [Leptolyngbya sp. RL_3_1]|nr:hypothetical protein [Leptolyngbya sp. RL_3_1]
MKQAISMALAANTLLAGAALAQSAPLQMYSQDYVFYSVPLPAGTYTFGISSPDGDADILLINSAGDTVAEGFEVGDDQFTLSLPEDTYQLGFFMRSCSNWFFPCSASESLSRQGDPDFGVGVYLLYSGSLADLSSSDECERIPFRGPDGTYVGDVCR